MKRYDTYADADMRLTSTVVRLKDRPVMIKRNSTNDGFQAEYLLGSEKVDIDPNSTDLDISSPPLGFYNGKELAYCTRYPTRRQKQGLSHENTSIKSVQGMEFLYGKGWQSVNLGNLARCILGEYPTLEKVISGISNSKDERKGLAFHRRYALEKIGGVFLLHHRLDIIGILNPNNMKMTTHNEEVSIAYRELLEPFGIEVDYHERLQSE